jgi:hypothetical protein
MAQTQVLAEIDPPPGSMLKQADPKTRVFSPSGGKLSHWQVAYAPERIAPKDSNSKLSGLKILAKGAKNACSGGIILLQDGGGDRCCHPQDSAADH